MEQLPPQPGSRRSAIGDKRLRRLVRAIRKAGGEVEQVGTNHLRVTVDGKFVTMMGATPSEYRGRLNALASLRRAGLNLTKADVT